MMLCLRSVYIYFSSEAIFRKYLKHLRHVCCTAEKLFMYLANTNQLLQSMGLCVFRGCWNPGCSDTWHSRIHLHSSQRPTCKHRTWQVRWSQNIAIRKLYYQRLLNIFALVCLSGHAFFSSFRVSDAAAGDCRAVSALLLQPKALMELTRLTCLQKARADRQRVSRNTIQRQNRARQRFRPASFHLQQPVLRSLSR